MAADFSLSEKDISHESSFRLRDLVKASLDTVIVLRKREINPTAATALVAMKTAFPDKLSNSELHKNPNLEFFSDLIWVGVEINDAVDMIPEARKNKDQATIENIFKSWKRVLRKAKSNSSDSEENTRLLTNYQREILFCEKYSQGLTTSREIIEYREVMNAISLIHNAAAILGTNEISIHLETIEKRNLTWENLKNKYSWIVNGETQNSTEEKLSLLFNLVMGMQMIDDIYDTETDSKLGLKTTATILPTKEVEEIAVNYFTKAEQNGVSKEAWKGIKQFFQIMKQTQYKFPKTMGGRRERLTFSKI